MVDRLALGPSTTFYESAVMPSVRQPLAADSAIWKNAEC
jgi:hypothetical protein